jgi:transcriptional regulator with XRE-family HTH domain
VSQKSRVLQTGYVTTNKGYEILLKRIAGNIKRIRKQKGLTQEQMHPLGFNYRHYQKIESGQHSFNLFTLYRLADAFNVRIGEFFK